MQYLLGGIKELLSFAFVLCTFPLGVMNWDLKDNKAFCQESIYNRPVLLVHGYLHNSSAWVFQRKALQKAGFSSIYTLNLGSPFHSIEEYSESVRKKALQIACETGRKDLILIGHSMGGLVCSYYATRDSTKDTVTHLITLGTPLSGTKLASVGIGQCAHQMRFNSPFITRLQKEIEVSPIHFLHLGSCSDLIIWPHASATFFHENASTKMYSSMGHFSFLFSLKVTQDILFFLKNT